MVMLSDAAGFQWWPDGFFFGFVVVLVALALATWWSR